MGAVMAELPEGFEIDGPKSASPRSALPHGFEIDAPAELPDVGAPLIGSGGEFSPGVPAVNEEVDRIARSANKNLIEPIKHPIETAIGIGRLGAGVAQYAGVPGDEFKPYVDELAKDYAKTYGSMEGFGSALKEDPVRVAMDASMGLGLVGKLGRAGRAGRVAAPSIEDLHEASTNAYGAARNLGVEYKPYETLGLFQDIRDTLLQQGHRDDLSGGTFRRIEELTNPQSGGPNPNFSDIEGVRQSLNMVREEVHPHTGRPTADARAAGIAIDKIDDFLGDPTNAVPWHQNIAQQAADFANEGRGNWAAMSRAQQIERATNAAELQAASTGSGANIDNATRQKIRAILTNPKRQRGFSQDELGQMDQIVRGTFTGNAARLLGKLAPSGVVSAGLSTALGHAVGHTIGVPGLGLVSKAIGDAATRRAAARLSEQVRLRSPLARHIGATPRRPRSIAPTALQIGRLPSNQTP
jgi:hypothetical protein